MGTSGRGTSKPGWRRAVAPGAVTVSALFATITPAWAALGAEATASGGDGVPLGWILVGAGVGAALYALAASILRRPRTARLRMSARRKDEALAMTSHELRTPLTSVIGFAHTLREAADHLTDDERDEILGYIVDEAESTLTLVEDLLVVTRLGRGGEVHVHSGTLPDLAATVREVVERSSVLRNRGIRVVGTAAAMGDEGRLRQVVRNLLTNAVEHGQDPIVVTIGSDYAAARIVVTDGGRGIPQATVDGMFDRDRAAPNQGVAVRSTGVGLWLSRELALRMGGDLRYLGAEGGTSFELTLPVGMAHAPEPQVV